MTEILPPKSKVRYVNQYRILNKDGTENMGWTKACRGHDDIYGAIACGDRNMAILNATITPETVPQAMAAMLGVIHREAGMVVQQRIAKQTLTIVTEIMESTAEAAP